MTEQRRSVNGRWGLDVVGPEPKNRHAFGGCPLAWVGVNCNCLGETQGVSVFEIVESGDHIVLLIDERIDEVIGDVEILYSESLQNKQEVALVAATPGAVIETSLTLGKDHRAWIVTQEGCRRADPVEVLKARRVH